MATIERAPARQRHLKWIGVGAVAAVGLVWLIVSLSRRPQMGPDEEAFHAVDALFTAVTARDERLLGRCEQRLHELRAAGKLPGDAADYLDTVVRQASRGRWESAAETLYGFMLAQRRDGTSPAPAKPPAKHRVPRR